MFEFIMRMLCKLKVCDEAEITMIDRKFTVFMKKDRGFKK